MTQFRPRAYVKTTCPFSFKFRLFVTEAGLAGQFDFIEMEPTAPEFSGLKADVERRSSRPMQFPTVETAPDEFMSDSDGLIAHYAALNGIDDQSLATLNFYRNGLFPTFLELFHICAKPLAWVIRLGRKPRAFL